VLEGRPHDHICPKCFSDDIERIPRRRTLDRVKGIFGWRVYQCCECGTRFYDHPTGRKKAS
jgi:hypothetical protein